MKSYEEMAREAEEVMGTEAEIEGLVRVRARVAREPRSVYSVRLGAGELGEIIENARRRDMTTSEFMRQAALAACRGYVDIRAGQQRQVLLMIRETAEQLYQAVQKLEDEATGQDEKA